jgi:hypothetical protein
MQSCEIKTIPKVQDFPNIPQGYPVKIISLDQQITYQKVP